MSWNKNTIHASELNAYLANAKLRNEPHVLQSYCTVAGLGLNDTNNHDLRVLKLESLGIVVVETMHRDSDCDFDDTIQSTVYSTASQSFEPLPETIVFETTWDSSWGAHWEEKRAPTADVLAGKLRRVEIDHFDSEGYLVARLLLLNIGNEMWVIHKGDETGPVWSREFVSEKRIGFLPKKDGDSFWMEQAWPSWDIFEEAIRAFHKEDR